MESEVSSERSAAVAPRPLAELLHCPPPVGNLLTSAATPVELESGEVLFYQNEPCRGLYLVAAGQLQRRAERFDSRLTLGPVRVGELVELAAALGSERHTCTLSAVGDASLIKLPIEALHSAFQSYPPLRMQLLEELAREVSRAYEACFRARFLRSKRGGLPAETA